MTRFTHHFYQLPSLLTKDFKILIINKVIVCMKKGRKEGSQIMNNSVDPSEEEQTYFKNRKDLFQLVR